MHTRNESATFAEKAATWSKERVCHFKNLGRRRFRLINGKVVESSIFSKILLLMESFEDEHCWT